MKTSLEGTRGRTQIGGGKGSSAICEVTPHQDTLQSLKYMWLVESGFLWIFPKGQKLKTRS